MSDFELNWTARLDNPTCAIRGGRAHLIVELEPHRPVAEATRRPLDLTLVLDVSGSMAGGKLETVRSAALRILQRLRATDSVTLVSFADDVAVHAIRVAPRSPAGAQLARELAQLATRGSTNLSAGWLTGVELANARREPDRRAAVLLLSDGQANAGVVEPSALGQLALQSASHGVATTCVGIGADYSTRQLAPIAEASGGRLHHADSDAALYSVLLGELDELETVAADEVELGLGLPQGGTVETLGSGALRHVDGLTLVRLGSLHGGVTRQVVLALALPAGRHGATLSLPLAVTGTDTATGAPFTLGLEVQIQWGDPARTPPTAADVLCVVRKVVAWLERCSADLNEQGDFAAVQRLRERHLPWLRTYARGNFEALAELERLEGSLCEAQAPMEALDRKEVFIRSVKFGRTERDLR